MNAAAKSVTYFGYYLYLVGLILIFVPNVLLSIVMLPETSEVWIRVVGLLVLAIGYYYHRLGLANNLEFFRLTIHVRIFILIGFIALTALGFVGLPFVGFGLVDALGAVWTYQALKRIKEQ